MEIYIVFGPHFHSLFAGIAIVQDNRHTVRIFIVPAPCLANDIGMIKEMIGI